MATIYAQLVSNRTKEEYMSIVKSLKSKNLKFKLSIGVYYGQDIDIKIEKNDPYYELQLSLKEAELAIVIFAKTARELYEKVDVLTKVKGI